MGERRRPARRPGRPEPGSAPARPGISGEASAVRRVALLQSAAGNAAAARYASGAVRLARRSAAPGAEGVIPEQIVNDLRRAINTHETYPRPKPAPPGPVAFPVTVRPPEYELVRKVDAGAVIRALDGLTATQVSAVKAVYSSREGGRSLEEDLFGKGATGFPSAMSDDDRARIAALMKGSRAALPGEAAPEGRMEADAVEIHGLLSGGLSESERERVMALHRRPVGEIDRMDAHYALRYGKDLGVELFDRITGLQHNRLYQLRSGDIAKADAVAIEDKRRQIEASRAEQEAEDRRASEFPALRVGGAGALADYQRGQRTKRQEQLAKDIEGIVDLNRREALADPGNAGVGAEEAVRRRLGAVLGIQGAEKGTTLGGQLAATLRSVRGGGIMAAAMGSLAESAAARLRDMEARKTTSSERIAELMRELRAAAEHDVMAKAYDPAVSDAEKERIGADVGAEVDRRAREYVEAFVQAYDDGKGDGRSYAAIVASASAEGRDMLTALRTGGGRMDEVTDLDLAIRRKDRDRIVLVLSRQPSRAALEQVIARYEALPGRAPLREALFALGSGRESGIGIGAIAGGTNLSYLMPLLTGRKAALAQEALARPAVLGGQEEVDWLVGGGTGEVEATEAGSGLMGLLRQAGDDPETQDIMNESAGLLSALREEWMLGDPWGRPRQEILAEMRRIRATLTGDAVAYEAENEQMRSQIRAAVSFAVQVALAIALPGAGSGFLVAVGMNIGATVAANAVIYGDRYSLAQFRGDVIGGLLGAGAGRLGRHAAEVVVARAARPTAEAARRAGVSTALAREASAAGTVAGEVGAAGRIAGEIGEFGGGAAGATIGTQQNQFTLEDVGADILLNLLGGLRGRPRAGPAGTGPRPEGAGADPGGARPDPVPAGAHGDRTSAPGPSASRPNAPALDPGAAQIGTPGGLRGLDALDRIGARAANLGPPAPGTDVQAYAERMLDPIAAEMQSIGAARPDVDVVEIPGRPDRWGYFDHEANKIVINPLATMDGTPGGALRFDIATPEGRRNLLSTLFHEARHAEQMFHALRYMARPANGGPAAVNRSGVDPDMIAAALANPLPPGNSVHLEIGRRAHAEFFGNRRGVYDFGENSAAAGAIREALPRLAEERRRLVAWQSGPGAAATADPAVVGAVRRRLEKIDRDLGRLTLELQQREEAYWGLYVEVDARLAEADLMTVYDDRLEARLEQDLLLLSMELDLARESGVPARYQAAFQEAIAAANAYRTHWQRVRAARGPHPGGGGGGAP